MNTLRQKLLKELRKMMILGFPISSLDYPISMVRGFRRELVIGNRECVVTLSETYAVIFVYAFAMEISKEVERH
jgi:hypothetical protein